MRPRFDSWVGKICWRRDRLPTPGFLGFPCGSAGQESACNAGDPGLIPGYGKIPLRRNRLPTPVFLGFPCGSAGKESTCNAGDLDSIPGLGRFPGEGQATYSSILAWRIPWTGPWGHKELDVTERLSLSLLFSVKMSTW